MTQGRLEHEAEVLLPDREVVIVDPDSGENRTVKAREFRFKEGLKAQQVGALLIADLGAQAKAPAQMTAAKMLELFADHADTWMELCALSTGLPADTIARLRDPSAWAVSNAVWEANSAFFLGRVIGINLAEEAVKMPSGSAESSTRCAPQDTGAPTT